MRYIASPSVPPQRREEKDKFLILEGVGGRVLIPHNTGKCCIWKPIRLIGGIIAGFLILRSFFNVH
jgi:hypothetical protein